MKTNWVGGRRDEQREKGARTYFKADHFLDAIRADELPEHFMLSESVFLDLAGRVTIEIETAKLISDVGIILLLQANMGAEVDGLVMLATQMVEEQDGG